MTYLFIAVAFVVSSWLAAALFEMMTGHDVSDTYLRNKAEMFREQEERRERDMEQAKYEQ